MIEYIRGAVVERTPTSVVVEANGVGYFLSISLNTYNLLKPGAEAKVYVHEVVSREGNWDLYGFAEASERKLFLLLNTVSGVGPSAARLMLSTYTPDELTRHIAEENEQALKAVKGIGTRSAQRIILELKDKVLNEMGSFMEGASEGGGVSFSKEHKRIYEEVEKAFVALGYSSAVAHKVVAQLIKQDPSMSVNDMIRKGLQMM